MQTYYLDMILKSWLGNVTFYSKFINLLLLCRKRIYLRLGKTSGFYSDQNHRSSLGLDWEEGGICPPLAKKNQRRKKKKKTKKILNFSSCCDSTWGSLPGRFSTRGKRKCVNMICTIQWIKLALEFTFPVPKLPLPRASETEVMSSNFPWLPVMPETDTLTPREDDGEIAGPSHFHKNSRELLPYLVQN